MACAENDPSDQIRKRDVRCGWNGPAVGNGTVGLGPKKCRDPKVQSDWTEHPACGCKQRSCRLFPAQTAVFEDHGLPHFLGRDGKEEGHEDVIDEVVEAQNACALDPFLHAVGVAIAFRPIAGFGPDPVVHPERVFDHVFVA